MGKCFRFSNLLYIICNSFAGSLPLPVERTVCLRRLFRREKRLCPFRRPVVRYGDKRVVECRYGVPFLPEKWSVFLPLCVFFPAGSKKPVSSVRYTECRFVTSFFSKGCLFVGNVLPNPVRASRGVSRFLRNVLSLFQKITGKLPVSNVFFAE